MQGYEAWTAANGRDALALGAENEFDLIFSDVVMDGLDGFDVLKGFRETLGSQAEIVLMTGQASVEAAIEAVQHGANDYICKPFSIGVLQAIATAVEQRRYPSKLIAVEGYKGPQQELLGNSPAMIEVVKTAARVAVTELPVMIRGESGTGKELIARLIHRKSLRSEKPFVAVNCGALPDTLLESELFGHTRGAFTGADSVRRGLFEEADGGTLLLDEVTETSQQFQVKLLRILQEGEFRPLGTNTKEARQCSRARRDKPRPAIARRTGFVPPRPALSLAGRFDHLAAAEGEARRHSLDGACLLVPIRHRQSPSFNHKGCDACA